MFLFLQQSCNGGTFKEKKKKTWGSCNLWGHLTGFWQAWWWGLYLALMSWLAWVSLGLQTFLQRQGLSGPEPLWAYLRAQNNRPAPVWQRSRGNVDQSPVSTWEVPSAMATVQNMSQNYSLRFSSPRKHSGYLEAPQVWPLTLGVLKVGGYITISPKWKGPQRHFALERAVFWENLRWPFQFVITIPKELQDFMVNRISSIPHPFSSICRKACI